MVMFTLSLHRSVRFDKRDEDDISRMSYNTAFSVLDRRGYAHLTKRNFRRFLNPTK